jgi:glutamate-ammonia-ligase adenylyltransferase
MSFAARVTRHPIPFNPERGAEALDHMHHLPPELRPLIEGTASCSPYLAGLIRREGHWLSHALEDQPEDTLVTLLREAGDLAEGDLDSGLRKLKRRAALLVALADLGGVWSLQAVTQAWTDFADACLAAALRHHVAREARRGKIPGQTEEDAHRDGAGWWRWPWARWARGS